MKVVMLQGMCAVAGNLMSDVKLTLSSTLVSYMSSPEVEAAGESGSTLSDVTEAQAVTR